MRSTVRSLLRVRTRAWGRAIAVLATAALVGCEGTVTLDVETTHVADPGITAVLVDLDGVELQGSGGTETLRFDAPVRVDLLDYVDGNLFRVLTDEELPDGRYTGARLLFSSDDDDGENDVVGWFDGREFELNIAEGTVSDVAFTVDQDDSSRESVVLTLDLRQSLSFDDASDVYTLTPVLRGVRIEDTGQLVGNVTVGCPSGSALEQGGAVYLFSGEGRTPDDRDGADEEPYLTTRVTIDAGTTAIPQYAFSYIPEGDYTIALTCDGDEDDAATSDDLRFQGVANVEVRAEEIAEHNFN